jgi:glycosidase
MTTTPAATTRRHVPQPYVHLTNPEWLKDATLYQLHLWHFTPEGTLRAAAEHLPRLADLGVSVVWLSPIHEIGAKNRKGERGSPYAIKDHRSLDPGLGTMDDLRDFVRRAHDLDLRVILDWVGNHTSWDAPLLEAHPEWYARDWKGDLRPPLWFDWDDVVSLDYSSEDLREYMAETMAYWVCEADVDGYRCDAAGLIPLDFWETVREDLEAIKPVFMLGEWESRELHARAFDATYASHWAETMFAIGSGRADVGALCVYYAWDQGFYPREAMLLKYVSNHDTNHEATEFERLGDLVGAAIVLSVVGSGIPMIYTGQEAGNPKRLAFFEADPVEWREHPHGELYRRLFRLKRETTALWNGGWGAPMLQVRNSAPSAVLSFVRRDAAGSVLAVLNLSREQQDVALDGALLPGTWTDAFSGEEVHLVDDGAQPPSARLALPAGGYRVFTGPGERG